ncbi:DUF4262 domain-containing protein [Gryllotalpicola koreensis]|uniref:DUF4262 domain-containing protein n=1 Tax=Gryllotalpicola koreensis TaxID=993086 RepID=UPI0031D2A057
MNKRSASAGADWFDEHNAPIAAMIRTHGVAIQQVSGEPSRSSTSFSYTIGLFDLGQPELLVLGLPPLPAYFLLNDLARRVRAGKRLAPGEVLTLGGWAQRFCPEVVPNPARIVRCANAYYRRCGVHSVPVLQLTWDDEYGRFPWEEGYSIPTWIQPRPGEFRA